MPWSPPILLESLFEDAQRRATLRTLRSHPELTLEHIADLLDHDGPFAAILGSLLVGELLAAPDDDGLTHADELRLALAQHATGAEFDEYVLAVLVEAKGRPCGASYLRARLGGPRWKLQASLKRLADAGLVERSGATSSTRYWATGEERS